MWKVLLGSVAGLGALTAVWWGVRSDSGSAHGQELLNVSYDPTRELWRDLNARFIPLYEQQSGVHLDINQSHGGSSSQARSVNEGLEADVVTLALWSDTDTLRKGGLVAEGWEERLPNHSLPYLSTIVFVVRNGNPKGIHDWPDLVRPGIQVISPNPKTSGNGKLSFLAAWGAVLQRGGTEAQARDYVRRLYQQTPVLDTGARGSTITFSQKKIGDVHLTWENEAYLEVAEGVGTLEIIYPSRSIQAEPYVAVVDGNVDKKGTRATAEAYLKFLYTPEAQEIIAQHHYRPTHPDIQKKYAGQLPPLELFRVTAVAGSWAEAQQKFFAEGGVFDQIYQPGKEPRQ
jgi:sulfate transport system substrate-binding protein